MLSQIQGLTRGTKGLTILQGFDERHLQLNVYFYNFRFRPKSLSTWKGQFHRGISRLASLQDRAIPSSIFRF